MANDIPSRPQTLDDLITGLMQSQDDSGDSADTQLFDAQVLTETVAITDATTLSVHPATYRYDAWADYDALVPLEPGLIHWWKCHEASGNLADSGSSPAAFSPSLPVTYGVAGPLVNFPAETAVQVGSGGEFDSAFAPFLPPAWSAEVWVNAPSNGASFSGNAIAAFENSTEPFAFNLSYAGASPPVVMLETDPLIDGHAQNLNLAGPSIPINTWHHLVFTFDGSGTFQLWADGVLSGTLAIVGHTVAFDTSGTMVLIASGPPGFEFCELAIYDHVLTPSVIAQHYQVGAQGVPDARYGYAVYA